MPRAALPSAAALLFAAPAAARPAGADLSRALRARPAAASPVAGRDGAEAFRKMSAALAARDGLRAAPCEGWDLARLDRVAADLYARRDTDLDAMYRARGDKRALHFSDLSYKQRLWRDEAGLRAGSRAWNLTRDGKCAEVVQWWAHHLTEPQRAAAAAAPGFALPLLPARGPEDAPAGHEYTKQATCVTCHTAVPGSGSPPVPAGPPPPPAGQDGQYCAKNATTGLPPVWYDRRKMCNQDWEPACAPCEGAGGYITGDGDGEWTPVQCEVVAAPGDSSLEGNITVPEWPAHFTVFEYMLDGAASTGGPGAPPIDPCAPHNWVVGNYTLYYDEAGVDGPVSRIDGGGHQPDQWALPSGNVYLKPPQVQAPCLCISSADAPIPTFHDPAPPMPASNLTYVVGTLRRDFITTAGGAFVGRERLTLEWVNRTVVADHWVANTMHFWFEVATGLMVRRYQYNGLYVYDKWDVSAPDASVFVPGEACAGARAVNMSCIASGPTPAPAVTPPPSPFPFGSCLNEQCTMHMAWGYDAGAETVALKIDVAYPDGKTPGWAGVGFVPEGQHGVMANASFIVGYVAPFIGGCARVSTNGPAAGALPNGPADFALSDVSVTIEGQNMSIVATRPFAADGGADGHSITDGVQTVIFAAGSSAAAPGTCDADYTSANYHDLTASGMIGNRAVDFSAGSLPPTPAPAPASPPPMGLFCTYLSGFAANVTLAAGASEGPDGLLSYGDTFGLCSNEKYTYIPAGGVLDISANYADPDDCFSQLKTKFGGAFVFNWNGTTIIAKNSVFPALYLQHVDAAVCPVVP